MEVSGEQDQRNVDRRQVMSKPAGQVEICDRAPLGADTLGDLRQRTAEPVRGEDQSLARDHA